MTDGNEEQCILSDYKAEDENTHHSGGRGGHADEDDDEDGGRSHKTYNCANQ